MNDFDRIYNYLKKWVGYCEKDRQDEIGFMDNPEKFDSKGKNNFTVFARDFYLDTGIQVQGGPWCDTFINACFIKVFGKEKAREYLHGFSAYTPQSANFFKERKLYKKTPVQGALVFFKNDKRICHIGFVYKYDDTYIYTIEGNTSNDDKFNINGGCVAYKKHLRYSQNIDGYGVINYMTKSGWQKENENWYYYQNGEIVTNKFIESNGLRYYVGKDGKMAKGQYFIDGVRHVFNDTVGLYIGAELVINDTKGVKVL